MTICFELESVSSLNLSKILVKSNYLKVVNLLNNESFDVFKTFYLLIKQRVEAMR